MQGIPISVCPAVKFGYSLQKQEAKQSSLCHRRWYKRIEVNTFDPSSENNLNCLTSVQKLAFPLIVVEEVIEEQEILTSPEDI